ncbi:MAG: hypothetical protein Q9182_006161 [Xanthomendoza sp. 2 TL-2023]
MTDDFRHRYAHGRIWALSSMVSAARRKFKSKGSLMATLNAASAFYGPVMFFTKLSLFILYYRLFNPSNIMRYLIYFGVAFNFLFYTIYLFIYAFYCPNTSKRAPTCQQSVKVLGVVAAAINIASDFYILLIPLCAVSNLQLPPKKKLGLLAIFFTGFLACLCSIISLHYRIVLARGNDNIWNVTPVLVISTVEFNIGIICSCLPTLPALFRRAPFASSSSSRAAKKAYIPDSGNSGSTHQHAAVVGAKGFGRLGAEEEEEEEVEGDGDGDVRAMEDEERGGGFEMVKALPVAERDERAREWFRLARM